MKVVTFAAGLAAGYVLGTRAGRERFEQIAANARKANEHPSVVQAKEKAKELLNSGAATATTKLKSVTSDSSGSSDSTGSSDTTDVLATPAVPKPTPTPAVRAKATPTSSTSTVTPPVTPSRPL